MKLKKSLIMMMCAMTASLTAVAAPATRNVNVSNFSGLNVSSGIEVELRQGNDCSVRISADPRNIDNVKVVQRGEMLNISYDSPDNQNSTPKIKVYATSPRVTTYIVLQAAEIDIIGPMDVSNNKVTVNASQAGEVEFDALTCRVLDLSATQASEIEVDNLSADEVSAVALQASDVKLGGSANTVSFNARQASDIKAQRLRASQGSVSATQSSTVRSSVSGRLAETSDESSTLENIAR